MTFQFPRAERLKRRDDIRAVFSRKKGVTCFGAKLFLLENGLTYNRIAFTFGRKFGNAVKRNYARRLSREVYRHIRHRLKPGYDLVLLIYPGNDVLETRKEQLRILFFKAGLYMETE